MYLIPTYSNLDVQFLVQFLVWNTFTSYTIHFYYILEHYYNAFQKLVFFQLQAQGNMIRRQSFSMDLGKSFQDFR